MLASRETRDNRAILNHRDEPLADVQKYRRLHLILGDSNLSPWSTLLKLGTTGLVLDALENGLVKQPPVLQSPVQALHEISRDLGCKRRYAMRNGPALTAVEIQKWYWQAAAKALHTLPPDNEKQQNLELWRQALDDIDADPERLGDRADWRAKYRFFEKEVLPKLGSSWEEAKSWSWIMAKTTAVPVPPPSEDWQHWLKSKCSRSEFAALMQAMGDLRLNWRDYPRQRRNYFLLRAMDVRFHDLGCQDGSFGGRRAGQSVPGITAEVIDAARREPPRRTRAWLRGRILCSPGHKNLESMDWDRIHLKDGSSIPMTNPFNAHDPALEHTFRLSNIEERKPWHIWST